MSANHTKTFNASPHPHLRHGRVGRRVRALVGRLGLLALAACGAVENNPRLHREQTEVDTHPLIIGSLLGLNVTVLATVSPPTVGGTATQASGIFVDGVTTYVAYNVAGETQSGAVDQIDSTISLLPVLKSEATYATSDINSLFKSGGTVYAVGATSDGGGAAQLLKLPLVGNKLPATPSATTTLTSYAGTGVVAVSSAVLTVSGDTGHLGAWSAADLSAVSQSAQIPDARGIAYSTTTNELYVVAGQPGRVIVYNAAGTTQLRSYSLGGNAIAESKSTIQAGKKFLAVSLGNAGAEIICAADGSVLATIPAATPPTGRSANDVVTNAVWVSDGLVFTADGEAGVRVYTLQYAATGSACGGKPLVLNALTSFTLGTVGTFSANDLRAANGTLIVASGKTGYKIVSYQLTALLTSGVQDFN